MMSKRLSHLLLYRERTSTGSFLHNKIKNSLHQNAPLRMSPSREQWHRRICVLMKSVCQLLRSLVAMCTINFDVAHIMPLVPVRAPILTELLCASGYAVVTGLQALRFDSLENEISPKTLTVGHWSAPSKQR